MKLGDGKLDAWNRNTMLIFCLVFCVIVIVVGWRLRIYQREHMPVNNAPISRLG
ncbi:MAG: hypothetical protein WCG75_04105 [Armatimonadota bacterium]